MHRSVIVVFITFSLFLQLSESIVCTPDICAAVNCVAVTNCEGSNKIIKPGGFCNCCDACHTILDENEKCSIFASLIRGAPPPLAECGNGLVCHEGKCKSFKSLGATAVAE